MLGLERVGTMTGWCPGLKTEIKDRTLGGECHQKVCRVTVYREWF